MNPQILSIPQYLQQPRRSTDHEDSDMDTDPQGEDGVLLGGEADDGKSGNKLTLSILLHEELIEPGDGVLSIDYLGQSFRGDLLPVGKIRSAETGLVFNNPSAWAIYCKKIINPAKKSGCGWASIKYKGRKMDYFKTVWLKRKAQREAENAKNEAAHALTALSASLTSTSSHATAGGQHPAATTVVPPPPPTTAAAAATEAAMVMPPTVASVVEDEVQVLHTELTASPRPVIKHNQIPHAITAPRDYHVELESFVMDGKIQPFTVSVSTSAILVLDLHSHMANEDVCGYLAGHWDVSSHNLAITTAFPCLLDKSMLGSEEAQRVESEIYDKLYGNHLSLVGWYHSSPRGPSIPTVKDCFDQLDFQIKLLGNGMETYTPCVGLICSPYESSAKSLDSSVVVYWIYPPSETNSLDYGRPMRMSYSAVSDPCLSQEVLMQLDKVIQFYKEKSSTVPFLSMYNADLRYIDKLGKSLLSKFPQDQDENLWHYIRTMIIGDDVDLEKSSNQQHQQLVVEQEQMKVDSQQINGRNTSIEEEIDDDEENALKEKHAEEEQEEIDDDEENALARTLDGQNRVYPISSGVNFSPLSFNQVISTSPPRVGNNGELDLRISGNNSAQTITMYSLDDEASAEAAKEKALLKAGQPQLASEAPQDLSMTSASADRGSNSTALNLALASLSAPSFSRQPVTASTAAGQQLVTTAVIGRQQQQLVSAPAAATNSMPISVPSLPYSSVVSSAAAAFNVLPGGAAGPGRSSSPAASGLSTAVMDRRGGESSPYTAAAAHPPSYALPEGTTVMVHQAGSRPTSGSSPTDPHHEGVPGVPGVPASAANQSSTAHAPVNFAVTKEVIVDVDSDADDDRLVIKE